MNTDRISIPVDIAADPAVMKAIADIKARFAKEFQDISIKTITGAEPFRKTTLTGTEQFEIGGRKFEATGRGKIQAPPESVISETGDINIADLIAFSATIREVKEKLNADITEEGKRLRQFKDSIKFQPLSVKQEAIKKYVEEFGDINNELSSRLEKISQLVARKDFDKLKSRISLMSPEEGIREYEKYMQSENALLDRAAAERRKLVEVFKKNVTANQKLRFNQVRDKISGLDIKDQVSELEKILPTAGGEFKKLIERDLGKLKDQLKGLKFRDVRAEASLKPLEERAQLFQKYIDDGGEFVKQAQREIQRTKNSLGRERIKDVKFAASLKPLEEREKLFEEFRKNTPDLSAEMDKAISQEIAKVRDKLKGLRFRDVKAEASLKPLTEREQLFRDYIASGGEFVKEAEREITRVRNQVSKTVFRDAKSLSLQKPLEDREAFWNDFKQSNKQFVDQANQEIQKVRASLSRKKFSEAKISASLLPIEQQEKFWKDFSVLNNDTSDRVVKEWKTVRDKVRGKTFKDTKVDALNKPIELREQVWQDYINSGGEFTKEANREIEKIRSSLSKKKFRNFKANIAIKPIELQQQDYQQLLIDAQDSQSEFFKQLQLDPALLDQVKRELEKVKRKVTRKKFQETKQLASTLPIEQQEQLFQDWMKNNQEFNLEASKEIAKVRSQLKKKVLGEAKADALSRPIQDRQMFWIDFARQNNQFATEAQQEINKVRNAISKRAFTEAKMDILSQPIEQREQLWNQFKTQNAQFATEADREIQKVRKQMKGKVFADFKTSLIGQSVEDQIKAWQGFIAANNEFTDVGNAQIKKLTAQWVSNQKNLSRQKFRTWLKGLQTLDPSKALAELDTYITAPFSKFVDDAKLMRDRIKKSSMSTAAQMKKEKDRQVANLILLGAGAGLGLLGPAGFPLLNIGFAAMSGQLPGAIVVGFFTALGQTIQAVEHYRQKHIEAANAVGAIPKSFKIIEAQIKGFEAILGASILNSQAVGMEARLNIRRSRDGGVDISNFQSTWTDTIEAVKTEFEGMLKNPPRGVLGGNNPTIMSFLNTFGNQQAIAGERLEAAASSAYRNMVLQANKSNVGIETDPYESWKRMQQAAFDPTRAEEMEIQREQLKTAKEILDAIIKDNAERKKEPTVPWAIPIGF